MMTHFGPSEAVTRIRAAFGAGELEQAVRDRRLDLRPGLIAELPVPLLTEMEIEQAFARRQIGASDMRLLAGRKVIDFEPMGIRRGSLINLKLLGQLARQGITIVINRLDRRLPALADFAYALTNWLNEEIEVVVVLTYGGTSGFDTHHDEENAFIVQLSGSKEWRFQGPPVERGIKSDAVKTESGPETKVMLHAGDVMFLPAGLRHQCTAGTHSLHLGVLIKHTSAGDLADGFAKTMASDPALNVPLLSFLGDAEAQLQIDAYRARLHHLVDALDLSGQLARRRSERRLTDAFSLPIPRADA